MKTRMILSVIAVLSLFLVAAPLQAQSFPEEGIAYGIDEITKEQYPCHMGLEEPYGEPVYEWNDSLVVGEVFDMAFDDMCGRWRYQFTSLHQEEISLHQTWILVAASGEAAAYFHAEMVVYPDRGDGWTYGGSYSFTADDLDEGFAPSDIATVVPVFSRIDSIDEWELIDE